MRDPETILADDPGSVVFSRYAEQLSREGRFDQAMDVLQRGIRANPFHAPGYSVLAELLFQLESVEEAVENIMSALELDPQMPRDLFRLGTQYLAHDPSKAEPFLKAALAYEPKSVEVAVSLEKARQMADPSLNDGDIPEIAGDFSLIETPDTRGDATAGFDEPEDSAREVDDFRDLFRKPPAPVEQEERDFLALMGEPGGGTIDEELDSLFQPRESQLRQEIIPRGHESEESGFDGMPLSTEMTDRGGSVPDVKPAVPEMGWNDLSGEDDAPEPPADSRSFDALSLDALDDDDSTSDEKVSLKGYVPQPVEEMGENADFFDIIPEHEDTGTEDDLDTLFDSLSMKHNRNIPAAKTDQREPEAEEAERSVPDEAPLPVPGKMRYGGAGEISVQEQPVEYGIADHEKDEGAAGVLEITDVEEYNLARFGFDSIPEEDLPVLSDAERTELMALIVPRDDGTGESAVDGESAVEREALGLGDLSLEDLEKPDDLGDERSAVPSGDFDETVDAASSSVPIGDDSADETHTEDLGGEGIDYSDVLSAWTPDGEESSPPPEMEPESFSIAEIMENLAEPGEKASEAEEPVEDLVFSGLVAVEPEIPVTGESDAEMASEIPESNGAQWVALSSTEPEGMSSPLEQESAQTRFGVGEGTGSFALPMMDGLFDLGQLYHPLTDEQTELIDDFLSGKEPESEPDDPVSAFSIPADDVRYTFAPDMISPSKDTNFLAEPGENELLPGPEETPGGEVSAFTPDTAPEPTFSLTADEGWLPSISPNEVVSTAQDEFEELPDIEELMQSTATESRHESLEDLIGQYQDMMTPPAPIPLRRAPKARGPIPPPAGPTPPPEPEREPKARRASKPLGSYTATMAEIYVSQGLITRAMDIYSVLAENNPGSEQYGNRLLELKRMQEQQPDAS